MKELEDYNWFPPFLRNFQTAYIGFVVVRFRLYTAFVRHLRKLDLPQQVQHDLCSGSGEPAIGIFRASSCFSRLILSDKFPVPLSFDDERICYETTSFDVVHMNFNEGKCYTMFNAFHHFSDAEKQSIIQKMQASGAEVFIVELLEPTFTCFFKILFATTLGCLLFTPFIRPFSLKRLFFTYVLPINLFTISFDGILSVFKSRSPRQYRKLFATSENPVEIMQLKNGWHSLLLLHIRAKP